MSKQKYTKEELLDIIRAKAEELGRAPFGYEIPQRKVIVKNFGSWDNALEAAGLYINRQKYTDEQLLEIIKEKAKELGRKPRRKDISQADTIAKRFGSWNKALEAAGICASRKKYTDEQLLEIIKEKAKELGRAPYRTELSQEKATVKRFGSWVKALELSGMHPSRYYDTDITGQKFGRLTVLEKSKEHKIRGVYVWICQCECGNITTVRDSWKLRNGGKHSCGCLQGVKTREKMLVENTHLGLITSKTLHSRNTSGIRGVCWNKKNNRWSAYISFQSKRYALGEFKNKEDAIKARKEAEKKYFKPMIEKHKYKSPTDTDPE